MSDVVTGEAVPLELRLAKLPSRMLAIAIDAVIYAAVAFALFSVVSAVIPAVDAALATALGLATVITTLVAVPATVETLAGGRSVGKIALGLRVVRDDGGPIRARHALVRALSGVFADFILTVGVGAIFSSLLNERGKRIGDILAGTVVLRERIPATAGLPPVSPQAQAWASSLELSRLPNDLALAARNYLSRYPQLAPHIRDDLGARLADQVAAVVSPPPPAGMPAPVYLAAVLHERGRRETQRHTRPDAHPMPTARAGSGGFPAPAAPPGPADRRDTTTPDVGQREAPSQEPVEEEERPRDSTRPGTGFVPPA